MLSDLFKSESARLERALNAVMFKIYVVSGDDLFDFVLPSFRLRQCIFFRNCCKINSKVLGYVYDGFGRQDL